MRALGILVVSPFFTPNIGGVETHLDDLVNHLLEKGHRVRVITYTPITTNVSAKKFERRGGLEIRRLGWIGFGLFHILERFPLAEFLYLFPNLFLYSLLFIRMHRKEIDIIHGHGMVSGCIAVFLSKVFKRKSVVSVHAIYNFRGRLFLSKVIRIVLGNADCVMTLSLSSKQDLESTGLLGDRIKVFTYWVNQEMFRPLDRSECQRLLGFQSDFIALFVGRLLEKKGVRLLLEVAQVLDNRFLFVFVGDGPLEKTVSRASTTLSNVIYRGKVVGQDLVRYYNAANVVVVPSLYEEGFGRVILESLSCGVPVIGSRLGAIPEVMDQSVGDLIEPSRSKVRERLEYYWKHPEELMKKSSFCRTYAQERFSEERNSALFDETYAWLAQE